MTSRNARTPSSGMAVDARSTVRLGDSTADIGFDRRTSLRTAIPNMPGQHRAAGLRRPLALLRVDRVDERLDPTRRRLLDAQIAERGTIDFFSACSYRSIVRGDRSLARLIARNCVRQDCESGTPPQLAACPASRDRPSPPAAPGSPSRPCGRHVDVRLAGACRRGSGRASARARVRARPDRRSRCRGFRSASSGAPWPISRSRRRSASAEGNHCGNSSPIHSPAGSKTSCT